MELQGYLVLKVVMEPLEDVVSQEPPEKTDFPAVVEKKDQPELLATQEEMALTDSPDRKEMLELQDFPESEVSPDDLARERRVSLADQDS